MNDKRFMGVVVAADSIPEEICNRFVRTLNETTYQGLICSLVSDMPDFTRSKCRNQGILSQILLGKCSVIVCVDVDMLIPPDLVAYTLANVQDGKALWAKCRNLELKQEDKLTWTDWLKLPVRESGTGSWVAMTTSDWLKTGGWDERLTGYGGEDDALVIRRKEKGIETRVTCDFPLMHVNHLARHNQTTKERLENLELGKTQPPKNYLTAKLPILDNANNHFNIFTTSRCTRSCPQCSQRGFRKDKAYGLPIANLEEWIDCTKKSGYPLYDSVILTGGEPLLWDNLEEGVHLIAQAKVGKQLSLFSNGDRLDLVTDSLMESLTTLRLSHYGNNTTKIKSLKECYGSKVTIIERQQHYPIPTELAGDEVLPAQCGCEGPALIGRQVYGCAMLVTVANELGIDLTEYPESQCKLQVGYLELLAGFPRTRHDCCRGCIGNLSLRKNTVSANP